MFISLRIISFKGQPYENTEPFIFHKGGGKIGRSETCNLVLTDEDKIISRNHAIIFYENGRFMLKDTSLAGTFFDDNPVPLHDASIALTDGMMLRIGEYQIQVDLLSDDNDVLSVNASPDFGLTPIVESDGHNSEENNSLINLTGSSVDDDCLISENPFAMDEQLGPSMSDQQDSFSSVSPLHDSFIPPSPAENGQVNNEIPDDFNFEELFELDPTSESHPDKPPEILTSQRNELLGESAPELKVSDAVFFAQGSDKTDAGTSVMDSVNKITEQAHKKNSETLYTDFLQGAKMHQAGIALTEQTEKMHRVGAMFRQFVDGTMAVLRSRAEFKSLFRVTVTTIKKTDNNPLKFSVTTDEALKHLLDNEQDGFKQSVEAIVEGFQDILNHQMAIQAGIQASIHEILSQFAPDRIERQFEDGLVLNKKAKCWDRYCKIYSQLSEQAIEEFYGDAFAKAYEQQMKQILTVNQKNNQ